MHLRHNHFVFYKGLKVLEEATIATILKLIRFKMYVCRQLEQHVFFDMIKSLFVLLEQQRVRGSA